MHQTSHELLQDALRRVLAAAMDSGCDGGGIGSTPCRASAALYLLLDRHPVDRRGRCRSCRGLRIPLVRRHRICRVLATARFYLYQPESMLLRLLASELHPVPTPPPTADAAHGPDRTPGALLGDPDATDVLPVID